MIQTIINIIQRNIFICKRTIIITVRCDFSLLPHHRFNQAFSMLIAAITVATNMTMHLPIIFINHHLVFRYSSEFFAKLRTLS